MKEEIQKQAEIFSETYSDYEDKATAYVAFISGAEFAIAKMNNELDFYKSQFEAMSSDMDKIQNLIP